MSVDVVTLAIAKKYTDRSVSGTGGALVGQSAKDYWLAQNPGKTDLDFIDYMRAKSPYIGTNGNWFVWDVSLGAYADTGLSAAGQAGAGVPEGGRAGQVLVKLSNFDFDTAWAEQSASGGVFWDQSNPSGGAVWQ
jgi:hypothetical protein